jgi:hypothetical protein
MWRKLTIMLFLLVLAQTANALPISETNKTESSEQISISQIEQQNPSTYDNDESEDSFNLPRLNRLSPSLFTAEIQTTPNYVLVIEFFKIKLTAGLFKNLANPPVTPQWFEQLSHNTNSSRLSGWKDGNFLYSSKTTYHS